MENQQTTVAILSGKQIAAVAAATSEGVYRVVIRFEDRIIRGTVRLEDLGSIEQLLQNDPHSPLDTIRIKLIDTGEVEEISTHEAKAVFFVKTFDGDLRRLVEVHRLFGYDQCHGLLPP